MFKRAIPAIIIVAMACFSAFDMAAAQESQVIHFQGLLTGPDGGPLRTDTYDINFSIWDQESGGVDPVWSETQVVEVTDGLFDVFLGSVDALSADVFTHTEGDSELRYLEIQVVGDDPMIPRTQIAKTPNSFVSSRVLGDVVTGPGSFRMVHPPEGPGIEMFTDDISNTINFRLGHPPEQPAVDILSDAGNSAISFRMIHPPEGPNPMPAIEMDVDAARTSFRLTDPDDDHKGFDVFVGGEGNSAKLMDPADGDLPAMQMTSDDISNGMVIFWTEPMDNEAIPAISMDADGPNNSINFRMFNPQPEPPAGPLLEMNTTQYGANLAMAAPGVGGLRNEITDPMFKVYVDTSGSSVQLMDPADPEIVGLELVVDTSGPKFRAKFPQIPGQNVGLEVMTSSTGPAGDQVSLRMFNPQPEPPAVVTSMVSNVEGASLTMYAPIPEGQGDVMFDVFIDEQGASLSMSDEIGKYMGLEPSPFNVGGFLHMYDPASDNTTVSLGSDGAIQARKATFGSSSNEGSYNLVVGMGNQASGDYNFVGGYQAQSEYNNCFVWADYNGYQPLASSAANQFLIRSTGGVTFYSDANMNYGVYLAPDASSWSSIIPPGPELNTRPVDGEEILSKIEELPLRYYSHKDRENSVEHIGPVAGDFNRLFDLGRDDVHIAMSDEAGVALAGVKELAKENRELKNLIIRLERRISELEKR
jgi:hypothetical protein